MTIKQLADDFLKYWESYETDGITHYKLKETVFEEKREYLDLLHEAIGDTTSLYSNYARDFVHDALHYISDNSDKSLEDLRGELSIEPDPYTYTYQLTDWLHENNNHVYYLTEVLENFGDIDDGFNLLALAQQRHKEEIAQRTIDALIDYLEANNQ